ncbi:MAG: GNAT family N-acetyltransferase [Hyphomonadaceae bacterium]|nr:GNAT family N-acetyltransferase [Hyphomonadaceae bacterium]
MRDVNEIKTKRLTLRPVRMSDAQRIARFCGDPGVGRNLAMTPLPYLETAAEGWIMTLKAREPLAREFVYAIDLPGEGMIGCMGVHQKQDGVFEIGYWFGRPFWGNGFATEALRSFTAKAHTLGDLQAGHFVDNPASGRVLEKGGFAYTGETPRLFSLARGESVPCKRMTFAPDLRSAISERASAVLH